MIGKFVDDHVIADKQAINELYNVGYYGRPKSDVLKLTLIEAAYLNYKNKLDIYLDGEHLLFESFFIEASKRQSYFDVKYIVYKDLRERGYYVQPAFTDFRVYPRGGHPGKTPAKYYVHVISERLSYSIQDLLRSLEAAQNVHKHMILAIVDEESDITFYSISTTKIKGMSTPVQNRIKECNIESSLLKDRVIIWNSQHSHILHNEGFYGHMLDAERLQLSLVESAYLLKNGLITIIDISDASKLDFDHFIQKATFIEPEFIQKYNIYENLRNINTVPKTGFKFGSHFRVYLNYSSIDKLPHSEYLVHTILPNHIFALPVLSRAVRLANSVRKKMIYAVYDDDYRYIDISRIKM